MSTIPPASEAGQDDSPKPYKSRPLSELLRSQIAWKTPRNRSYGRYKVFIERCTPVSVFKPHCMYIFCIDSTKMSDRYCISVWPPVPKTEEEEKKASEDPRGRFDRTFLPADYYHLKCFERLVDMSEQFACYQMHALTRHTWNMAGFREVSQTSQYFVDSGAERLIEEWKLKTLLIRTRSVLRLKEPLESLFYRAGLPDFHYQVGHDGIPLTERALLATTMAPWERDHPDDKGDVSPWNLFHKYLSSDDLLPYPQNSVPNLVKTLNKWADDVRTIFTQSTKAMRAMNRLLIVVPIRDRPGATYRPSSIVNIVFQQSSNNIAPASQPTRDAV